MVFYRKYRPQTIEELDSKDVRDILLAFLGQRDISHAFLFTGPKGLGKTSAARIVAKVVNCEERDSSSVSRRTQNDNRNSIEPCNKCDQCLSITNGTNIDVLEIDGASNRGIDEIRDLREKVRLSPAASYKKIYIIDEVHMLTQEAFNALLKTLEEPPPHVIFILCTTEPHKLPQTIVSRCMHVSFKKAGVEELVRSFKRIAKKEKLDIDDKTLSLVATLSDGSFRDGAKILEEMASFNKKITKELVEKKYQISNIKYQIEKMIESLSERDTKKGLQLVAGLVEQGVDMKYFLEQLISELHEMLLLEVGFTASRRSGQTSNLNIEDIKELVELLTRSYGELKYAVLPQLPLEMTIMEWAVARGPVRSFPPASARASLASSNALRAVGSLSTSATPRSETKAPRASQTDNFWQELINRVKSHNHSIAGVLRGCILKDYDGKKLIIETGYKFHKERLDDSKARKIIEKVCREISGREVSFNVLLKE